MSNGNFKEIEFGHDFSSHMEFSLLPNFDTIKSQLDPSFIGPISGAVRKLSKE